MMSTMLEKVQNFGKKYFLEGQQLNGKLERQLSEADGNLSFFQKHRRLVSFAIPAVFWHVLWWSYMAKWNLFYLFTEPSGGNGIPRYYMSITMIFGSMIAGATSEGGASVAFPVMTLVFAILPVVARDFSYMIQSVGMTSAAFTIIMMKVKLETRSLVYCTIGGTIGIVFGLEQVAPRLTPSYSKMYFVVIWFAFAFSLYFLNRNYGRRVFDCIPDFESDKIQVYGLGIQWKALVLLAFGFLGGIFSSMAGSGIDICSFACLTLLFRVSEKVATPTSVVLMAINTCVGFGYRQFYMGGVAPDAWGFFGVCVPVVVIGAPLGSLVGSHFHRLVLAACIYLTDTAQLILALIVVQPWLSASDGGKKDNSNPIHLTASSAAILVAGAFFFKLMEVGGRKLLDIQERRMTTRSDDDAVGGEDSETKQLETGATMDISDDEMEEVTA